MSGNPHLNNYVCQNKDGLLWCDGMGAELEGDRIRKPLSHGDSVQSRNSGLCDLPCLARQPLFLLLSFIPLTNTYCPLSLGSNISSSRKTSLIHIQTGLSALPWCLLDSFLCLNSTALLCRGPSAFAQSPQC